MQDSDASEALEIARVPRPVVDQYAVGSRMPFLEMLVDDPGLSYAKVLPAPCVLAQSYGIAFDATGQNSRLVRQQVGPKVLAVGGPIQILEKLLHVDAFCDEP